MKKNNKKINEKKINDGNKLIAIFLGWKRFSKEEKFGNYLYGQEGDTCVWVDENEKSPVKNNIKALNDNFLFHYEWNHLMPVVDKISRTYRFNELWIKPHNTYFYLTEKIKIMVGELTEDEGTCGTMVYKFINSQKGINSTWIAVVEFIKWHNLKKS